MEYLFVILGFLMAALFAGAWEWSRENSWGAITLAVVLFTVGLNLPFVTAFYLRQAYSQTAWSYGVALSLVLLTVWANRQFKKIAMGEPASRLIRLFS